MHQQRARQPKTFLQLKDQEIAREARMVLVAALSAKTLHGGLDFLGFVNGRDPLKLTFRNVRPVRQLLLKSRNGTLDATARRSAGVFGTRQGKKKGLHFARAEIYELSELLIISADTPSLITFRKCHEQPSNGPWHSTQPPPPLYNSALQEFRETLGLVAPVTSVRGSISPVQNSALRLQPRDNPSAFLSC